MLDAYQVRSIYDRLIAAGFKASRDAKRLYDAITDQRDPGQVLAAAQVELKDALIEGKPERLAAAQAAVTEATNVATVATTVAAMQTEYAVALFRAIRVPGFAHAAKVYNRAGQSLADAMAACDPDADPILIALEGERERAAWATVPTLVADVERHAVLLEDIVRLGKRSAYRRTTNPAQAGWPLGLLVTIGQAHVRRLVEALCWTEHRPAAHQRPSDLDRWRRGRAGMWGALIRCGATLAVPCDGIDTYEPAAIAEPFSDGVDPYDSPEAWQRHLVREGAKARGAQQHAERVRQGGGVA